MLRRSLSLALLLSLLVLPPSPPSPNAAEAEKAFDVDVNDPAALQEATRILAEEIKLAQQYGVQAVTLGTRILRAETAALAAIANVMYELGG